MRTRAPRFASCSRAADSSSSSLPARPTTSATRSVSLPGAATSSITLLMRAVGMLSITNQPRSSKVSAAWLRPAPDSPVMMRNSAIDRPFSPIPVASFLGPQEEEAGDGGGVGILLGPGDEPRRGRGLLHAGDDQAGSHQGIHIARQGAMDERDEHAPLDLFEAFVLHQVGPDAPVLLGGVEHLVVDPAAPGDLEQRVVQKEQEPAARGQH